MFKSHAQVQELYQILCCWYNDRGCKNSFIYAVDYRFDYNKKYFFNINMVKRVY